MRVFVGFGLEIFMKSENIVFKIQCEFLNIGLFRFPFFEFFPRKIEVFYRNNINKNIMTNATAQTNGFSLPNIIHKMTSFNKDVYLLCKKLPKHDRFVIGKNIENESLDCLKIMIEAALSPKDLKRDIIQKSRIKIEVLKKLITLLEELKIIDYKKCMNLQNQLQEISKMAFGWIDSLNPKKEQEAPE